MSQRVATRPGPARPRPGAARRTLARAGTPVVAAAQARAKAVTSTTPRLLGLLRIVAIAVVVLLALVSSLIMIRTHDDVTTAAADTEQYVRIQNIQARLLSAHALAANGFLLGGAESSDRQRAYESELTTAAQLIVTAGRAQPADQAALREVNAALVDYAAAIQAARSTNRMGQTVAQAYLDDASTILNTRAMPQLDTLTRANSERLRQHTSITSIAWPIALGVVTAAIVIFAAVVLARRTHRVLNVGLSVAVLAVIAATILAGVMLGGVNASISQAARGDLTTTKAAAAARAYAYDAKAQESLSLISRAASGGEAEKRWQSDDFYARQLIAQIADPATSQQILGAWQSYTKVHRAIRDADLGGDWGAAVARATTGDSNGSNETFQAFDAQISRVITASGASAGRSLRDAGTQAQVGALLIVLCALIAVVATWLGIRQRVREYR